MLRITDTIIVDYICVYCGRNIKAIIHLKEICPHIYNMICCNCCIRFAMKYEQCQKK
jgi:hypothetical protein